LLPPVIDCAPPVALGLPPVARAPPVDELPPKICAPPTFVPPDSVTLAELPPLGRLPSLVAPPVAALSAPPELCVRPLSVLPHAEPRTAAQASHKDKGFIIDRTQASKGTQRSYCSTWHLQNGKERLSPQITVTHTRYVQTVPRTFLTLFETHVSISPISKMSAIESRGVVPAAVFEA
jgi:hypothetical protein